MVAKHLYKYLNIDGGLKMLQYSNLQFTNATKFNDPFDCHPALYDYSNVPTTEYNWPPADFVADKGKNDMKNLRNSTWICSLSKVYDSLLMWSYYNQHKGVCIGLNLDVTIKCCKYKFIGTMSPFAAEVNYKDILKKTDYFKERPTCIDLWTTKAKAWEHEQEVRIITKDPVWANAAWSHPEELDGEESIDIKEIRYYPHLSKDCFESIYLGVNILSKDKNQIIKLAKKNYPEIKIYQMALAPDAFRLREEQIY